MVNCKGSRRLKQEGKEECCGYLGCSGHTHSPNTPRTQGRGGKDTNNSKPILESKPETRSDEHTLLSSSGWVTSRIALSLVASWSSLTGRRGESIFSFLSFETHCYPARRQEYILVVTLNKRELAVSPPPSPPSSFKPFDWLCHYRTAQSKRILGMIGLPFLPL